MSLLQDCSLFLSLLDDRVNVCVRVHLNLPPCSCMVPDGRERVRVGGSHPCGAVRYKRNCESTSAMIEKVDCVVSQIHFILLDTLKVQEKLCRIKARW